MSAAIDGDALGHGFLAAAVRCAWGPALPADLALLDRLVGPVGNHLFGDPIYALAVAASGFLADGERRDPERLAAAVLRYCHEILPPGPAEDPEPEPDEPAPEPDEPLPGRAWERDHGIIG